jgi:tetratricopeptide (TPR) repeat protein
VNGRIRDGLVVLAPLTAAFALACRLASEGPADASAGALDRLLVGSRAAVGGALYEQADRYFHAGVGHAHPEAFRDAFGCLREIVRPREHRHVEGDQMAETMPWFRMTTRVDPHNVEAYLVTAYWLMRAADDPERALEALAEARRHNPTDYRIPYERARILLRAGRRERAAVELERAVHLWPATEGIDPEEATLDLSAILSLQGVLREVRGDAGGAIEKYSHALAVRPGDHALKHRMERLRSEGVDAELARERLAAIFPERDEGEVWHDQFTCEGHHPPHGHDHSHDHDHYHDHDH